MPRTRKATQKKYAQRPGPPYPAREHAVGVRRKGNNGRMYRVERRVRAADGKEYHVWVPMLPAVKSAMRPARPSISTKRTGRPV